MAQTRKIRPCPLHVGFTPPSGRVRQAGAMSGMGHERTYPHLWSVNRRRTARGLSPAATTACRVRRVLPRGTGKFAVWAEYRRDLRDQLEAASKSPSKR
jgi:hypothetical protein